MLHAERRSPFRDKIIQLRGDTIQRAGHSLSHNLVLSLLSRPESIHLMNRALFKKVLLSVLVLILAGISVGAVQDQNCSNTSTGFIPLFDLAGGTYQGFEGGLYPGGSNHMPSGHLASGLELANQVEPLNSLGQPDPLNGKSVFLSVGMSNTRSEFVSFQQETANDIDKDPQLIVANGAAAGWAAPQLTNPDARLWDDVADKLSDVGLPP